MPSSGEFRILNQLAELADRCGVSPAVADIGLHMHASDNSHEYHYTFGGVDGGASSPEEQRKVAKVWSLLGLDETGFRRIANIKEAGEIVDKALSLAPRSRAR